MNHITAKVRPTTKVTARPIRTDHDRKLRLTDDIRELLADLEHWKRAPDRMREIKQELDAKWEALRALTPPAANTEPNDCMALEAARKALNPEPPKARALPNTKGRGGRSKLTVEQQKEALERLAKGETKAALTRAFKVSQSVIDYLAKKNGF
jgi:hypothetical protein